MLQSAEARGHGRIDRSAVTLQNDLPPLVGCSDSGLVTMPWELHYCQCGLRLSRQFALARPQQSALARSKWNLSKNGLEVGRSRVAEIRARAKKDDASPGGRLPSRV